MPSVNSFKSHFNLGLRSISIFDESRQIGSNQEISEKVKTYIEENLQMSK